MTNPVSMTAALKHRAIPLPASSVLQMMQWAGLVEDVEYTSSSGSGEIKHFLRLTERGLAYGVNLASPVSKEKTEVAIYPSRLGAILRQCHGGLGRYIEMNVP